MAEFFLDDEKCFVPLQYRGPEYEDNAEIPKIYFGAITLEDRQIWRKKQQELFMREDATLRGERERIDQLMHGKYAQIEAEGEPGQVIKFKIIAVHDYEPLPSKATLEEPEQAEGVEQEGEEVIEDDALALASDDPEYVRDIEVIELVCDEEGKALGQWAPRLLEQYTLSLEDVQHHVDLAMKYITRVERFSKRKPGSMERTMVTWSEEQPDYQRNGIILRLGSGEMMLRNLISLGSYIAEGLDADEKKA